MDGNLPDTQVSTETLTQSQEIDPKIFWGRLFALKSSLSSIDLHENKFTFGRHPSNNLVATKPLFGKHLDQISKFHFSITKEQDVIQIHDLSTNGTYVNSNPVGKSKTRVLDHDDIISINNNGLKVFSFFMNQSINLSIFPDDFRYHYAINSLLGSGAGGQVYSITHKQTAKRYAVKVIFKALTNNKQYFENEIRIMQALNHPNIVSLVKYFETNSTVYIILDFMPGGDLFKRIRNCGPFSEDRAKFIFYQILMGVEYIHSKKISHRDLKLENILLSGHQEYPLVKISDFGLSKDMARMKTCCGTPSYTAPEVLKFQPYNESIDIWSMGVILYICLTGQHPFFSTKDMSLKERIIRGDFSLKGDNFKEITDNCKHLIKKMLKVNPTHRIKIDDIFTHPWMENARMIYEFHSTSDIDNPESPPYKIPRLDFINC